MQKFKIIDTSNKSIHEDWYKALKAIKNYEKFINKWGIYENKKN